MIVNHFGDLFTLGEISKYVFQSQRFKIWNGFIRPGTGSGGGLL